MPVLVVVKFQIWLWNDSGLRARTLLSKIELFSEFPLILSSAMDKISGIIAKVKEQLAVSKYTSPLENAAGDIVRLLRIIIPVLKML